MKTKGISGSESIRRFIAKHPSAKPKEISLGLKGQGIKVSKGLISNVKYGGRRRAKRKRPQSATVHAAARRTRKGAVTVDQLLQVKQLVDSLGSSAQVEAALDMLERLQ
jgi:hypothetical protein